MAQLGTETAAQAPRPEFKSPEPPKSSLTRWHLSETLAAGAETGRAWVLVGQPGEKNREQTS